MAKADMVQTCLERPGAQAWYIAPSYAQAFQLFREVGYNADLRPVVSATRLQPYPEIHWSTGSVSAFRTFERPENLRCAGLDSVWLDEIQDIGEDEFNAVVRPLVSDRRGRITMSGQFRGENWYYNEWYQRGLEPNNRLFKSWRFPTSDGVMFQTKEGREELELAKSQLDKATWQQEYECVPIANRAAVFAPEDLAAITRGALADAPQPSQKYVMAMDLGRVVDHSFIGVLAIPANILVYSEQLPLGMRHEAQAEKARQIKARYGASLVVDSTGGAAGGREDSHVSFYRKSIPDLREFGFTRATKARVIGNLKLWIEHRKLSVPPECKLLLKQLAAYEFEYRNGAYDYHAPKTGGVHDDGVAMLAMLCWAAELKWYPAGGGIGLSELM